MHRCAILVNPELTHLVALGQEIVAQGAFALDPQAGFDTVQTGLQREGAVVELLLLMQSEFEGDWLATK